MNIYQVSGTLPGPRQAVLRKTLSLFIMRSLYDRRGCYEANKLLQTGEGKVMYVWEAQQKQGTINSICQGSGRGSSLSWQSL